MSCQENPFNDHAKARPLIRQSAIMAAAAKDSRLKKRTLTNLYNERPTWLKLAHQKLDQAVLAAYAATDPAGGWDESWADVWVETGAPGIAWGMATTTPVGSSTPVPTTATNCSARVPNPAPGSGITTSRRGGLAALPPWVRRIWRVRHWV